MADNFTETTTRSWLSRIGGSLKGILLGVLIVMLSFPVLWWNEGRAIDRAKTLASGRNAVIAISATARDPANDGALVHLSGVATTAETLIDPLFGVSANAIKLRRTVEMYQWLETESSTTTKNVGGSETTETTYSYQKGWSSRHVDSTHFKHPEGHQNPASMPYASETQTASVVTLGHFRLDTSFTSQLNDFETISAQDASAVPAGFQVYAGGFYLGTPQAPQVGDVQVRLAAVRPSQISVVGRQDGDRVTAAMMERGRIALLERGSVDADTMFAHAERANRILTWVIRGGGVLLMWLGLALILAPLRVFADLVPWIGAIVGAGLGLIAALLALALGLLTIALAWVFYRPALAGALAAGAAVATIALVLRARTASRQRPEPEIGAS